MANKTKRHLRAAIKNGDIVLPRRFAFLKEDKTFVAVVHREINGANHWCIEFKVSTAKDLLQTKREALELVKSLKLLEDESVLLKRQVTKLKEENAALEFNNKILLNNIEQNPGPERYTHSPRSFLAAAAEHNTDFTRNGFDGGLAGLDKK